MKIKKKKKWLKVIIYFVLSFKQEQVVPFWKVKNYQYFTTNIFHVKNVILFGVSGQKSGRAG